MLCSPSHGDEVAPGDPEAQVRARRPMRTSSRPTIHRRGGGTPPRRASTPPADRGRRQAGAVVEVLELPEAHLGVRRVGVRGIHRPDPAMLALGGRSIIVLEQLARGGRRSVWRSGVTLDSSRVLVSAQIAIRQSASSAPQRTAGRSTRAGVGRVLEVGGLLARPGRARDGQPAGREDLPVDRGRRAAGARAHLRRAARRPTQARVRHAARVDLAVVALGAPRRPTARIAVGPTPTRVSCPRFRRSARPCAVPRPASSCEMMQRSSAGERRWVGTMYPTNAHAADAEIEPRRLRGLLLPGVPGGRPRPARGARTRASEEVPSARRLDRGARGGAGSSRRAPTSTLRRRAPLHPVRRRTQHARRRS